MMSMNIICVVSRLEKRFSIARLSCSQPLVCYLLVEVLIRGHIITVAVAVHNIIILKLLMERMVI